MKFVNVCSRGNFFTFVWVWFLASHTEGRTVFHEDGKFVRKNIGVILI
jgi:hypothetical protein